MIDRYGAVKLSTIRRDFSILRTAIRAHDSEATEAAWLNCERWLGCVEALNVEEHRRVADWRAILAEVTDSLAAEIAASHPVQADGTRHPVTLRLYERDMIEVDAARAVLAEMDAVLGRGD